MTVNIKGLDVIIITLETYGLEDLWTGETL